MLEYAKVEFGSVTVTAFSRHGGVSVSPFDSLNLGSFVGDEPDAVAQNWERVRIFVSATGLTFLRAVHGNQVNVAKEFGLAPEGDGLVTKNKQHGLVALSADCVPFALVDPKNSVVAVGHAGWRGVAADLMSELSASFSAAGGKIDQAAAVLGPAICGSCYEVPPERVELFQTINPAAIKDRNHLDISAGVHFKLTELGYQINTIPGCTFEDPNLFSYRAAAGKPTGRQGLVAIINN